ncbi:phosphotriesterase family protein [Actinomadura bangladeshensis]|uniref:Phosphotriesterase n=1 Tax=Actinomadura bangladeshensis TaxID=453573 RepID=A0A4R4NXA3_9ACTN|nr:phosphotriesterase [Actinomadura bangladeshensis]TDC12800.1 phosphotriesterase [Actinomadura bangladeshensis]
MTDIQTVAGPVDSGALGRTLVHEHIFVLGEEYRQNYQHDWDEDEKVEQAVRDLNELKSLGIDTIIDPTVLGLGRFIPRIKRIAARTDLNIVVATGLYTFNDLPHQFLSRGPGLLIDIEEPLTDLFVRDLTQGIGDTGVRAATLKCAIDAQGLTPGVERTMRAVARALRQRIDTLVGLVRRGYAESIVVSHDASCFIDFVSVEERPQLGEKWNYRTISTEVIPALLKAGVTESTIETILVDNPRRYFEGVRA